MDIEGSEIEVIPDLIYSGSLSHVDVMMVEWHSRLARTEARKAASLKLQSVFTNLGKAAEAMREFSGQKHYLEVLNMDDESYFTSSKPLPICFNGRKTQMKKTKVPGRTFLRKNTSKLYGMS